MLVTSTAISPRIASLLRKAGLDLYQAARLPDAELLKMKGIGESALREIRGASVHVHYSPVLTPAHIRGCVLVIRSDDPPTDTVHLLALLSASVGFAMTVKGGVQIGLKRSISVS